MECRPLSELITDQIVALRDNITKLRYAEMEADRKRNDAERELHNLLSANGLSERSWMCMSRTYHGGHIAPIKDGSVCIFCGCACWENDFY